VVVVGIVVVETAEVEDVGGTVVEDESVVVVPAVASDVEDESSPSEGNNKNTTTATNATTATPTPTITQTDTPLSPPLPTLEVMVVLPYKQTYASLNLGYGKSHGTPGARTGTAWSRTNHHPLHALRDASTSSPGTFRALFHAGRP